MMEAYNPIAIGNLNRSKLAKDDQIAMKITKVVKESFPLCQSAVSVKYQNLHSVT